MSLRFGFKLYEQWFDRDHNGWAFYSRSMDGPVMLTRFDAVIAWFLGRFELVDGWPVSYISSWRPRKGNE